MKEKLLEFLQDTNFDFDQKTLIAFVFSFVLLILVVSIVFYGLSHEVKSASLIADIILGLIGLIGALLGSTIFTKQRIDHE